MEIIILILLEIYNVILNFEWQTFWIAVGSIPTAITGFYIYKQVKLQQEQIKLQQEQIDEEKDARLFYEFERTYYTQEFINLLFQEVNQFYIHRDYSQSDIDYLKETFNFQLNTCKYLDDEKKVFTYKGILIHPSLISHSIIHKFDKTSAYLNILYYYSSLKRHFRFFDKEKFKTEHYKRRYCELMRNIIIDSRIYILFQNEIFVNKKVIMEDDKFDDYSKKEVMNALDFFMSFSTPQK